MAAGATKRVERPTAIRAKSLRMYQFLLPRRHSRVARTMAGFS
jgi:hypothetical protein